MTLSLRRSDDSAGLRSTEKWSNSGRGWGNHQHLDVLEPSMSPLFYNSHALQSTQSMFPQLMGTAEQQALVQAFAQANTDSRDALLKSSNSSSMVESASTSDEDCIAPEIRMNCISSLGGGPVMPALASMLDCTESTGASLLVKEDSFRLHHPPGTSPGGSLSPCGISYDSLHSADDCTTVMAGLKRRLEAGDEDWMDQMHGQNVQQKGQQCEKVIVFQDSVRVYSEAPSSSAGVTVTYNSDPAQIIPSTTPIISSATPFLPSSNAVGGSSRADIDSMCSILFRHASQPVPSLEEIASTRPKRRNVRISKDPQSVAARHRRERISDRIRILQRLVPGGTKMDTASMLDEAIHYVKFLQLQLQTLEQIGNDVNNCDPQGNFAHPQGAGGPQLASLVRPFDLNRAAVFQAWPVNNKNDNLLEACPQGGHSTQWTSTAAM